MDDVGWRLMEEAVMRDLGSDEVAVLNRIARSYMIRRGLSDTLIAFETELAHCNESPAPSSASEIAEVQRRREAQLLCLSGNYKEAAMRAPANSLLRVELMCLDYVNSLDRREALLSIMTNVAPLVAVCESPGEAHDIYMRHLSAVMHQGPEGPVTPQPQSSVAWRINEAMLEDASPSALNVLISWSEWQEMAMLTTE